MKFFILAGLLFASVAHAKIPKWATSNTTKLNGKTLTTVCYGVGPSLDTARGEALRTCQSSASQFLKTKIRVRSVSVETERSIGFHQEITNIDEIENLNCDPQRDQIEETDSQFSIWMECRFDLNRAKVSPIKNYSISPTEDDQNLSYSKPVAISIDTGNKNVFLSTVPKCESIIVRGNRPRIIECKNNPMELSLTDVDYEAIIRARGYKPKTIQLKKRIDNETIQILFEK